MNFEEMQTPEETTVRNQASCKYERSDDSPCGFLLTLVALYRDKLVAQRHVLLKIWVNSELKNLYPKKIGG